jgi:hypothetical protein
MAAHTNLGARAPGEEIAGLLLVQASCPDRDAGDDATKERNRPLQKGTSVLEQFMHNLMLALGAWPI